MASVRVFVLDEDDRVLLAKSDYEKNGPDSVFWVVPGGGIEIGEFSQDAAVREVKEETGLDIEITRLLWVVEEKDRHGNIDFCHYFLAKVIDGELIKGYDPELTDDNQVIMDVRYLTREEINALPRVYPESILDEFWTILNPNHEYNPWRIRPSKGFGIR